jgi:hypothetical protein
MQINIGEGLNPWVQVNPNVNSSLLIELRNDFDPEQACRSIHQPELLIQLAPMQTLVRKLCEANHV